MIFYRENPKKSKKLLKQRNEIIKVAGYKIDIKKPIVFLHTSKEQSKMKLGEQLHLQIISKNNKLHRNKFDQIWNLYIENYRTLLKEFIKEHAVFID